MTTDLELARDVRRVLRPAAEPWMSVRMAAATLSDPMHPGHTPGERLRFVRTYYANAVRRFGEPAILAAAKTMSGCRWCLARCYETRYGAATTAVTAATRELLGNPCPGCARRIRSDAGRAVARTKVERDVASMRRILQASATPVGRNRTRATSPGAGGGLRTARAGAAGHAPNVSAYWTQLAREEVASYRRMGLPLPGYLTPTGRRPTGG